MIIDLVFQAFLVVSSIAGGAAAFGTQGRFTAFRQSSWLTSLKGSSGSLCKDEIGTGRTGRAWLTRRSLSTDTDSSKTKSRLVSGGHEDQDKSPSDRPQTAQATEKRLYLASQRPESKHVVHTFETGGEAKEVRIIGGTELQQKVAEDKLSLERKRAKQHRQNAVRNRRRASRRENQKAQEVKGQKAQEVKDQTNYPGSVFLVKRIKKASEEHGSGIHHGLNAQAQKPALSGDANRDGEPKRLDTHILNAATRPLVMQEGHEDSVEGSRRGRSLDKNSHSQSPEESDPTPKRVRLDVAELRDVQRHLRGTPEMRHGTAEPVHQHLPHSVAASYQSWKSQKEIEQQVRLMIEPNRKHLDQEREQQAKEVHALVWPDAMEQHMQNVIAEEMQALNRPRLALDRPRVALDWPRVTVNTQQGRHLIGVPESEDMLRTTLSQPSTSSGNTQSARSGNVGQTRESASSSLPSGPSATQDKTKKGSPVRDQAQVNQEPDLWTTRTLEGAAGQVPGAAPVPGQGQDGQARSSRRKQSNPKKATLF